MPPTNETGSVIVVGPDANGDHFEVEPGAEYELPEPPRTVTDELEDALGTEEPVEELSEDLDGTQTPPSGTGTGDPDPSGSKPEGNGQPDDHEQGDSNPPADTEGNQA